jgi:adenine phosphoribosyltransferase
MDPADFERLSPGWANLRRLIVDVPDFPEKGILYKDITPLLGDPAGLSFAVELMAQPFRGNRVDLVLGAESRGFVLGTAVAQALSVGFVPVRKPGKLPRAVRRCEFTLEYGKDALEIHEDAIKPGQRVLIVDDVLATGGTIGACCKLVTELGGVVAAVSVLIELRDLGGRERCKDYGLVSIMQF